MIKFSNEKSEALYYKLLEKFGKEEYITGRGTKKLRFPVNPKFGISRILFALAEFTEKEELFNYRRGKDSREKLRDKIKKLDLEVSEISNFIHSNSYWRIAKDSFEYVNKEKYAKKEKIEKIVEKPVEDQIKDQIGELIKENGYLFAQKVLIEELNKLNETIEEQKANLRKADEALSEAEAKKEQCLVLLYGTATEKEG
jgi:chemotaxis regulatin CheY-phosphate phosphatase CheZ